MRLENWLYTIPLRLRSLLVRHLQDEELEEELRDHIARQTEENRSRGMSEEEARLAALTALEILWRFANKRTKPGAG